MKKLIQAQPFHLVTISPWPILMSFGVFMIMVGMLNWLNNYNIYLLLMGLITSILCLFQWWRNVIRESLFQGFHTKMEVKGLKLGMLLFIISEVFFFVSIFWCYFHMYLSPSIVIGSLWPPKNLITFNPYMIPLLNTLILLSSGVFITWCHFSLILGLKYKSFISLLITILLGLIFTYFQYLEYTEASFTISDSVYGSIFFLYLVDFMVFMF